VHAGGVHIDLQVHWLELITLIPLACITCSSLGLTFGTIFDPRTVPLLFGIIILPLTFLGGTYYSWTTLAPVTVGGFHWLQVLVLVNPLIYINEGMRGALTTAPHMSLWVVYPVLLGFSALFLWTGTRNFRRRVIS
jgi:ABC-2 type transport system permease protein